MKKTCEHVTIAVGEGDGSELIAFVQGLLNKKRDSEIENLTFTAEDYYLCAQYARPLTKQEIDDQRKEKAAQDLAKCQKEIAANDARIVEYLKAADGLAAANTNLKASAHLYKEMCK